MGIGSGGILSPQAIISAFNDRRGGWPSPARMPNTSLSVLRACRALRLYVRLYVRLYTRLYGFRIGCGPWLIALSAHVLEACCPRCHAVLAVIEDRRRADRQTGFSALASSTALTDTFVQVVKQFREPFWVGPRWRDRRYRVRRCAVNGALHPVEGHALLRHRQTSDRYRGRLKLAGNP
eukprot:scaffold123219_cov57-Phaeocystis_antarctica.AAC.4